LLGCRLSAELGQVRQCGVHQVEIGWGFFCH
jgi:hypothetical protein